LRSALFLVHPRAGRGSSAARLRRLLDRHRPLGGRYDVVTVASPADADGALDVLAPGCVPVAVGGDGTAAMLAAALHRRGLAGVPFAIVPLGTGNILARECGIESPSQAFEALESGEVRRIDAMRTSDAGAPFALVSISGGFEGRFLARYARLRRGGRPLAALGALSAGWAAEPITLELDGQVVLAGERVFSAGLYNSRYYAAGIVMSPDADVADGSGECFVYRTRRDYAAALGGAACGRPRAATPPRWRTARLHSAGPLQVDGEPAASGSLTAWMDPGRFSVLTPRAVAEDA
jgi:diacylglycerol kinase family enzyme